MYCHQLDLVKGIQGGSEHRYWVIVIVSYLRANGYETAKEVPVGGGRTIDLLATRDAKQIVFEIETGKSDAAVNVQKCLSAGIERVVIVAISAVVRRKLLHILPADDRVKLIEASKLLKPNYL